jgi:uncharacterized protein YdhG (YjbR/CyaY superfamily)
VKSLAEKRANKEIILVLLEEFIGDAIRQIRKAYMEFEDYFENDELMKVVRETVLSVFPEAQERISYGMPAWFNNKNVLIYAKHQKNHLGIYPKPDFIAKHSKILKKKYEFSKGTIKVSLGVKHEELIQLVKDIIQWNLTHFD